MSLVAQIYKALNSFPSFEKYGLADQLRRAAVSIPSNIAEGTSRVSDKEFAHFLHISLGSAFEVETQLLIAQELGYISEENNLELLTAVHLVERQLNQLLSSIRDTPTATS